MSKKFYAVQVGSNYDTDEGSTRKAEARKMATQAHRENPDEEIRIVTCSIDDNYAEHVWVVYEG